MKKQTEDYLQNQCWIWFTNEFAIKLNPRPLFIAIPNDELNPIVSKRKNLTGRRKGAADVIIAFKNAKTLWIELKIAPNEQSQDQIDFQKDIEALGHIYKLAYTLEEFKTHVIEYYAEQ